MKNNISLLICLLLPISLVNSQVTIFDRIGIGHLRQAREFLLQFSGLTGHNEADFRTNLRNNVSLNWTPPLNNNICISFQKFPRLLLQKLQKQFNPDDPFFCDFNGAGRRSATVPTSVHRLRPGDIDIVGAIGDSLTAGNGAMATNIIQVSTENKGLSWTIGGQKTWRTFLTIPNILKEYNPKLYGFSLGDGLGTHRSSRFNTAEIGAMSRDITHQAWNLIARMKSDPNVDMQNHWKVLSGN